MDALQILRGWKTILAGRAPFLSIEITRECPLACPGCYAYGEDHLGGGVVLRQVSDFKGDELVERVLGVVDYYKPLHLSIVGGEPLVRFRELERILPEICRRGIHVQLVTSAVRPIPLEWSELRLLTIAVSIDGLAAEHDVRRKPATYDRILKHIEGHRIAVHCTATRQMTERPGYVREFIEFWSARPEVKRIWISLFTPQLGETSYEIIPWDSRKRLVTELLELRNEFPKLDTSKGVLEAYLDTPTDPKHCVFARVTRNVTADLRNEIKPCQFGGNPDCSQCGCIASAGMKAISDHRLPGGLTIGWIFEQSIRLGEVVASWRGRVA